METKPIMSPQPERRIFARELCRDTLILSWLPRRGSLDESEIVHETAELLQLIGNTQPTKFVLDLSHCDYIGTMIINAVLKLWKRISEREGKLVLCNVSQEVAKVLHFTRLDTIWPICGSRDQALHVIGG